MSCIKCGRENVLGQVFCKECLADMAECPVDPSTPVNLPPQQKTQPVRRPTVKKTRKPEEQVKLLRRMVLVLMGVLLAVCLAFAITTSALLYRIEQAEPPVQPGQNYSVDPSDEG